MFKCTLDQVFGKLLFRLLLIVLESFLLGTSIAAAVSELGVYLAATGEDAYVIRILVLGRPQPFLGFNAVQIIILRVFVEVIDHDHLFPRVLHPMACKDVEDKEVAMRLIDQSLSKM